MMLTREQIASKIEADLHQLKAPVLSDVALSLSVELQLVLQQKIDKSHKKQLPFIEFMQACLFTPNLGYYTNGRIPFGQQGDFITAPEISSHLAHALAEALKDSIEDGIDLVIECGAGSGQLAADFILYSLQHSLPLKRYSILELSPQMRELQRSTLEQQGIDLNLIDWITELPKSYQGHVIANELLDAIPIHRFCWSENQNCFLEQLVECDDAGFKFEWGQVRSSSLQDWLASHKNKVAWQSDVIYEAGPWRSGWLASLAESIDQGSITLIDYGYGAAEFFHPQRTDGTLQCFYRHQRHNNPLILCGQQDITASVNFSELCFDAEQAGLELVGFCTQSDFLIEMLLSRKQKSLTASAVKDEPLERIRQSQQLASLMMPGEMGDVVKVIAFNKGLRDNLVPQVPLTRLHQL